MSFAEDIFEQATMGSKAKLADVLAVKVEELCKERDVLRSENTRLRLALTAIMDDAEGINPELRALGYIPCVIMKTNLARGSAALKPATPAHLEKSK